MHKVIIGIGIVGVALFFSFIMNDYTLLYKITGIVALISLALSALFSGAFVDGDRMGRNLNSESKEDRNERFARTNTILLIGLPNLLTAVIIFLLMN